VGQGPSPPPTDGGSPSGAGGATGTGPTTSAGESADLRVQLGGPHRAVVGRPLQIRLTIANRGPQAAHDVTLTAKLTGAALEDVSIDGARCRDERQLVCAIGSLAPGHRRRLVLTATPRRAGRLEVAAADSSTADPTPADGRDRLPIKVTQR
jgi:hypothetical protein